MWGLLTFFNYKEITYSIVLRGRLLTTLILILCTECLRHRVLTVPGSHFLKRSTALATPEGPFQLFDYVTLCLARSHTCKPAENSSESLMIIHGWGSRDDIDSES